LAKGRQNRPQPGLAFSLACDSGCAIGIVTHNVPQIGSLIWIAELTFEGEPTVDAVSRIERWRWCVFFPLSAAIRRKIVTTIDTISVPEGLEPFPLMRSGSRNQGWTLITFEGGVSRPLGPASDPALPI
jgi:hypothetical protein